MWLINPVTQMIMTDKIILKKRKIIMSSNWAGTIVRPAMVMMTMAMIMIMMMMRKMIMSSSG